MRIANYARKSIFSDKSDSIDNQFRMCQNFAEALYGKKIDKYVKYSDEDYTGANTDRPSFQRLLDDVKSNMFDVVIVYQLDRLSRDVRDFSNVYSIFNEHNVMFISVKENIDTSTPIGRAMMYVTVVFAQMERETIAQRVTDNMIGLAGKGFWVGGKPPYGYEITHIIVDGRKHKTLKLVPDAVKFNLEVFHDYLRENTSINHLEKLYRDQGKKTPNGYFFSMTQIYKILTMPYCVPDTQKVYEYYERKGCNMSLCPKDKWDGKNGVMVYGRTTQKSGKHSLNPPENWIVVPAHHEPFIDEETWLRVQERFSNKQTTKYSAKYPVPLLKGVLKCGICGRTLGVARKKTSPNRVGSYYKCYKRDREGTSSCNLSAIPCPVLDEIVQNTFDDIAMNPEHIYEYVGNNRPENKPNKNNLKDINKNIKTSERNIKQLLDSLKDVAETSTARKYIIKELEREDLNLQALKREYDETVAEEYRFQEESLSLDNTAKNIQLKMKYFKDMPLEAQREIVNDTIEQCIWDNESLTIKFKMS